MSDADRSKPLDFLDDEARRLVEEAGLSPDAIPSSSFFSAAVDTEVDAARRAAARREHEAASEAAAGHAAAESAARDADAASGFTPTSGNELQAKIAARRAAGNDEPLRLGVLLSGSGTNLQAIIDRIAAGTLNATIELVVSSRPSAFGLQRAEKAGLQTLTLSKEIYANPMAADEVIASELYSHKVDYVIMAGYMRMVHAPILVTFPNRVVNLHPALLPSFPGAHAIDDAYARGVKVTGVTVHFANAAYDAGPIIAQRPVIVEEGWSVDELEAHIHEVEHELYPDTIQLLAEGRVQVRPDGVVEVAE